MKTLNKMLLITLFGVVTSMAQAANVRCDGPCTIKWSIPGTDKKGERSCGAGSSCSIQGFPDNTQVSVEFGQR